MNDLPTILHPATATKRLKELMLNEYFDKFCVSHICNDCHYYVEFPTGETVVITAITNTIVSVCYYNSERTEKFEFRPVYNNAIKVKHEIALKFVYAIWNVLHRCIADNNKVAVNGWIFHDTVNGWAREFGRGYAKYLHTNKDIVEA
jgi:hypothetical protein